MSELGDVPEAAGDLSDDDPQWQAFVAERQRAETAITLLRLWVRRDCAHTFPSEECEPCADRDRARAFLSEQDEKENPQ